MVKNTALTRREFTPAGATPVPNRDHKMDLLLGTGARIESQPDEVQSIAKVKEREIRRMLRQDPNFSNDLNKKTILLEFIADICSQRLPDTEPKDLFEISEFLFPNDWIRLHTTLTAPSVPAKRGRKPNK